MDGPSRVTTSGLEPRKWSLRLDPLIGVVTKNLILKETVII